MINMIVAVDENWGIGKNNKLLAHISPDLKYFKQVTEGHIVVMGYNTFLSLKKPLPNRHNVVLTSKDVILDGVTVIHSINELLEWIKEQEKDVFIIGGASVYKQMLPYTDKLYITHILHKFEADTFFPNIQKEWSMKEVFGTKETLDHKYRHWFTIYEKRQ